jgi:two-component system sensor kinase FixL
MMPQSGALARQLADDLEDAHARLDWLKSQNVQLSRLTAMERIALDFAHELNQPLAAVMNYIRAGQHLLREPSAENLQRLAAALDGAMTQSLHASEIVKRVRGFVASGETETSVQKVSDIVRSALTLAMHAAESDDLHVATALDRGGELVLVDGVQIQQVLVNLIHNAVHAMQDCRRRELRITSRRSGGVVEISVADNGRGVPPEIVDRLFEPFVTTRSNGTGLGLTICNAIIAAHGGTLSYERAPDGGSIFHFTVTAAADALP